MTEVHSFCQGHKGFFFMSDSVNTGCFTSGSRPCQELRHETSLPSTPVYRRATSRGKVERPTLLLRLMNAICWLFSIVCWLSWECSWNIIWLFGYLVILWNNILWNYNTDGLAIKRFSSSRPLNRPCFLIWSVCGVAKITCQSQGGSLRYRF